MRTVCLVVVCTVLLNNVVNGFLPNPFSAIDINDYTHTDITELGILAAVAK